MLADRNQWRRTPAGRVERLSTWRGGTGLRRGGPSTSRKRRTGRCTLRSRRCRNRRGRNRRRGCCRRRLRAHPPLASPDGDTGEIKQIRPSKSLQRLDWIAQTRPVELGRCDGGDCAVLIGLPSRRWRCGTLTNSTSSKGMARKRGRAEAMAATETRHRATITCTDIKPMVIST